MESERLKSEITSRNDLLTRIDGETEVVEAVSNIIEIIWASTRENLSAGFPIKWYSNQPA